MTDEHPTKDFGLAKFSSAYHIIRLNIQPYEAGPTVPADLFKYLDELVYAQTDAPVMMRTSLDDEHAVFTPSAERGMPFNYLGVPEPWFDTYELERGEGGILVLTPETSYQVCEDYTDFSLDV